MRNFLTYLTVMAMCFALSTTTAMAQEPFDDDPPPPGEAPPPGEEDPDEAPPHTDDPDRDWMVMGEGPVLERPFRLGAVGVGTLSTFGGERFDMDDMNFKFGGGGGLRAVVNFNEFIGIQPEVLYNQRGTAFDDFETDDAWVNLHYIKVPLLLRLGWVTGPVMPKVVVGVTPGYLLDADVRTDQEADEQFNIAEDDFEDFSLEGTVGVGVDVDVGGGAVLSVEGRYNNSLLDITADDDFTTNMAIEGLLGIEFAF